MLLGPFLSHPARLATLQSMKRALVFVMSASLSFGCKTMVEPVVPGDGGTCMSSSCATLGASCGRVGDGCGATLECGACPSGQNCGGDGVPNVCGTGTCTPLTCSELLVSCGTVSDGCSDVLECGTCASDSRCMDGECVPVGPADDAGPGVDGGPCTPVEETCNGLDEDCDGDVDEGACTSCACERWTATTVDFALQEEARLGLKNRLFQVAFDSEGVLALLYGAGTVPATEGAITLELRRLDGSLVVAPRALGTGNVGPIAFHEGAFVALWTEGGTRVRGVAIRPDGSESVAPRDVISGFRPNALISASDALYLVGSPGSGNEVRQLTPALDETGSAVPLPVAVSPGIFGYSTRGFGDTVAILGSNPPGTPGTVASWAVVRGGALVASAELGTISTMTSTPVFGGVASADGEQALVCFGGPFTSCREASLSTGMPTGPAFVVSPDPLGAAWDVHHAGCAYQIPFGSQRESGPAARWSVLEIDETGSVELGGIDSIYAQPNQTTYLLRSRAGALIRVTDRTISVLTCAAALPEPTCEEITTRICEYACGDADIGCTMSGECATSTRTGSSSFPRSRCPSTISCDTIDRVACAVALDGPQECTEVSWLIPASCRF